MNLDLNLLGQAADVLYMKLYNPACQSQLIDCFMRSSVLILGRVADFSKLSSWVSDENKKVWEMGRILNLHL